MKRKGSLTKEELVIVAEKDYSGCIGDYIYDPDYKEFADLDGTEARRYLESKGFEVVSNRDTGRNGSAVTSCGIHLSTNGFISRR